MRKDRKASRRSSPSPAKPAPPPPSGTVIARDGAGRNRAVFLMLGAAILAFLATLPWQRRQWAQVARTRQMSALQETRAKEIARAHQELAAAEERVRAAPDNAEARIAAARILAERRDLPRAAAHLRAVESAAQHSPGLAGTLSGLYQKIGYLDRALAMARLEKRLAPESPSALLNLGFLHLQLGWQTKVRDLFRQAAKRAPDSAEPHLALALWHDQAGDLEEAGKELAAADRLRPGDWQIALLRAQNFQARGRYDKALETLEAGMERHPTQPQLYAQRAHLLLEQARSRVTKGLDAFGPTVREAQRCLSLDPNNADAHFILGKVYRDAGDEVRAIRAWERVLQINPEYPSLRLNLGRLLVHQGQRARGLALIEADRRARAEADEFNRLVTLAGMKLEDMGRRRELARWCQAHGRLSRAILEWEEVLARLPEDPEAARNLRACKARRGDP